MKDDYTQFKATQLIKLEKGFNLSCLGREFPNIVHQFTIMDWLILADAPRDISQN